MEERMNYSEELRKILETYRAAVAQVEKTRRPFDGLLGMGRKPSDDPCHMQMDQGVEALMQEAAGADAAADEVVSALIRAAKEYEGPEYARFALIAAQRHGIGLIPRMSAGGRKELKAWFDKAYPKRTRFPMQKKIAEELGK